MTISMGDESRINGETDAETKSLLKAFDKGFREGRSRCTASWKSNKETRSRNVFTIQAVCDEVKEINKEFGQTSGLWTSAGRNQVQRDHRLQNRGFHCRWAGGIFL